MPNPQTNFFGSDGVDLGNKLITKEYLLSVYPQIANQLTTPELWVWGRNQYSQLGTNDTINRSFPTTTFAGGANWKQVSCGYFFIAGIKTDGSLWTWGRNDLCQLGVNDTNNRSTPITTFSGGNDWKQVSCGWYHTSAIKTDGSLWTWGAGGIYNLGQLGTNDTNGRSTPVTTFAGGTNWKQVSSGSQHTAAIKTDGTLWVWGQNSYGNLGINDTNGRTTPVTTFAGGTNWKQVAAGTYHTTAIKTDGTLWVWGFNSDAQLGVNDINGRTTPVTTFAGGTNWKQVSSGLSHTSAIKTDGSLWTWGAGRNTNLGQLGVNDINGRTTPVTTFAGGTNWKQVSSGLSNTSAIKTDGSLWVWGYNNNGQLGINDTTTRSTPITTFAGGTNWKQVCLESGSNGFIVAIQSTDIL